MKIVGYLNKNNLNITYNKAKKDYLKNNYLIRVEFVDKIFMYVVFVLCSNYI